MSDAGAPERLTALDMAHIVHPHQVVGRPATPLVVARARGARLWDIEGNEYIDATCGLWQCAVGHGREELAAVAAAQTQALEFYASFGDFSNPPAIELAARLCGLAGRDLNHVLLSPPLTISTEEIDSMAAAISTTLECL